LPPFISPYFGISCIVQGYLIASSPPWSTRDTNWELKLIKFDSAFDTNIKSYEKHIAVIIKDAKVYPEVVGRFLLNNLRVMWYAQKDSDIDMSIGLDTISNVFVTSFPTPGTVLLIQTPVIWSMCSQLSPWVLAE
jgi:hypothetical protein